MSSSEILTIATWYHHSGYKTFKSYYEKHVLVHMRNEFPNLVSYNRFLELRSKLVVLSSALSNLSTQQLCDGISFIDSFPLAISHQKRISSHKGFKNIAQRGKTSTGWFYGFKLHVVINRKGEIIASTITAGNVSDNNGKVIDKLTQKIYGKVYGDKGYLLNKKMFEKLYLNGIHIITKIRSNMKNKLMDLQDKLMLKKRGLIESVGSILKEFLSLEHSRHRSFTGFLSHVFSTIAAYFFKPKKPSIPSLIEIA